MSTKKKRGKNYKERFQTITMPAMKKYKELNGHLLIPRGFCVPNTGQQWPEGTHGCKLGLTASTLRVKHGVDIAKDKLLDDIDFTWDPVKYQFEKKMLVACTIYVDRGGDLNTMSCKFKVPKTSTDYPPECRGYNLGNVLYQWRVHRNARLDLLERIKALGFKLEPIVFSSQDLAMLLEAIHWLHLKFGYKVRVNYGKNASTCLPDDHPTLPGLQLGKLYHRAKKYDETIGFSRAVRDQLEVYPAWHSVYHSNVYSLLVVYFCLFDHLHFPVSFKVPSYYPWPPWAWGEKLGIRTQGVRKGLMSVSVAELFVLGNMHLKWGPKGCPPSNKAQQPLTTLVPSWPLQANYQEQIVHEKIVKEDMRLQLIQYHLEQQNIAQEQAPQEQVSQDQVGQEYIV